MSDTLRWEKFNERSGQHQQLPEERKPVMLAFRSEKVGTPDHVSIGYLRHGGGDPDSPFFVVPGLGGTPYAWAPIDPEATVVDIFKPLANETMK